MWVWMRQAYLASVRKKRLRLIGAQPYAVVMP